ncbi:MAG: YraN family protein [Chitinivibrionales bacterium]|nr:YraN family protein [Chitinivibrionales bacterium]
MESCSFHATADGQAETSEFAEPHTRSKGREGEEIALAHLLAQGYTLVMRNYQRKRGELDLIMEAPDKTLVFVEVKSARSGACGHPFYWIDRVKQRQVVRMARLYCAEKGLRNRACRFDAIAIVNGRVDHLKNAFLA